MTDDYELNEAPKSPRKPDSLIACIDRIERLEVENKRLRARYNLAIKYLRELLDYIPEYDTPLDVFVKINEFIKETKT